MKKIKNDTTSNSEMVTISRAEYEELQSNLQSFKDENAELTGKVEYLMEQMRLARAKRFGTSSEQTNEDGMVQLSYLFNEAEVYAAEPKAAAETTVAAHKRKKKSGSVLDIVPDNLPVDVVEHRLSPEELSCPACGTEMVEIGKEVHRSLKIIPAQVRLQEDWYYTYACKKCEKEGTETPVLNTPKEKAIIPGGFASPEAVAHIIPQGTLSCPTGNSPCDPKVRHGLTAVPPGAGIEAAGCTAVQTDHVQLDFALRQGLARPSVQCLAPRTGEA